MQSTISTTLAAGLHLEQTLFTPSFGSTETTSIILTHPLTKYLHYDIPYQNNSLKRKRNYEEEEEESLYLNSFYEADETSPKRAKTGVQSPTLSDLEFCVKTEKKEEQPLRRHPVWKTKSALLGPAEFRTTTPTHTLPTALPTLPPFTELLGGVFQQYPFGYKVGLGLGCDIPVTQLVRSSMRNMLNKNCELL